MYVYLDEWVWIRLAKASTETGNKESVISNAVIQASNNSAIVFPLSICHLLETSRRRDNSSRKRLAQFMIEVSKGNAILPFTKIFIHEIRNALLKLNKQPSLDLIPLVFGKGIPHILASMPVLKPTAPNSTPLTREQREQLTEMLYSKELIEMSIIDSKISKELTKDLDIKDSMLASVLERLRSKEYSHPDKTLRNNLAKARFLVDIVLDDLIAESMKMGLSPEDLGKHLNSKEDLNDFLESTPTLNTFFSLNHAAKRNISRPIKPNDQYDIGALSIAIPYCDVVVTEREWTNIAKESRLDEIYDTVITSDLNELYDSLREV